MLIGCVTYENFGPFERAEHDFSRPGITLIEGDNGKGKSYLLEGVVWCLYGQCIRSGLKGDDVIRRGKRTARVSVTISRDNDQVVITRTRGDPKVGNRVTVAVNGEDRTAGREDMTQTIIDEVLGCTYATFASTVAFGARSDVRSFFLAPDSGRKALFDSILRLEVYAAALEVAKSMARSATDQAQTLAQDESCRACVLEERKRALEAARATDLAGMAAGVDTAQERVETALAAYKKAKASLEKAEKNREALRADVAKTLEQLRAAQRDAEAEVAQAQGEVTRLDAGISSKQLLIAGQVRAREQLQTVAGCSCPTCGQEVGEVHVKRCTKAYDSTLKSLREELGEQQQLRAQAKTAHAAADRALRTVAMKAVDDAVSRESRIGESEVMGAREEVRDKKARLDAAQESLREKKRDLTAAQEKMSRAVVDLSSLEAQLAAVREKRHAQEEEAKDCAFWVEGFGNQGIKSFIIEGVLARLGISASNYARRLWGGGITISLSATKQLKSKDAQREKLDISADIPGYAASYAAASKGQRLRMDIAILLALRDLAQSRYPHGIRQFFADEMFDGMDKCGCEAVAGLLRDMSAETPTTLITHDTSLKPYANYIVTVRTAHNRATLRGKEA